MSEEYYFATFKSTHDALIFDKEVSKEGYKTIIMPVPRNITHSCGLAVRFNVKDRRKIKELVKEKKLMVDNYYVVQSIENERIISSFTL